MDWYKIAQNDWNIYQDKARIAVYVQKGKITDVQYQEISGESYVA